MATFRLRSGERLRSSDHLRGSSTADADLPNIPLLAVQMAFTSGPRDYDPLWVDLSDIRAFSTRYGKSNQHGRVEAGTLDAVVDNRDREFDPFNTASPYYATRLTLDGSSGCYVSTTDLDPTGDLDVAIRITTDEWITGAERVLVGQLDTVNTTGWELALTASDTVAFRWYEGGVLQAAEVGDLTEFVASKPIWLRAVLDADNGAGGHTVTIYVSASNTNKARLVSWLQYEEEFIGSGTTSIDANNLDVVIGADASDTTDRLFTGAVYAARIVDGTTEVAHPDFTFGWSQGTGVSKEDTSSMTWTTAGTAEITADEEFGSWVRQRRPFRILAEYNGITYPLSRGYTDSLPNTWPGGPYDSGAGDAVVSIKATDAFKVLAQAHIISYPTYMNRLRPSAYYRFDEPASTFTDDTGAGTFNDSVGGYWDGDDFILDDASTDDPAGHALQVGSTYAEEYINADAPSVLPALANTAARFGVKQPPNGTLGGIAFSELGDVHESNRWLPQGSGAFTIMGWIKPNQRLVNIEEGVGVILWMSGDGAHSGPAGNTTEDVENLMVYIDHETGLLHFIVRNKGTLTRTIDLASTTVVADSSLDENEPTFFVACRTADGYGRLYINGVLEASGQEAVPTEMTTTWLVLGRLAVPDNSSEFIRNTHYYGDLDELAIFHQHEVQADDIANLYTLGTGAFRSRVTPGDRCNSVLDVYGWPEDQRFIADGTARMSSYDFESSVLEALMQAAEAEDGEVFMHPSGQVYLYNRRHLRESGDPVITFGDQDGEIPYQDLVLNPDDETTINVVTVTVAGSDYEIVVEDRESREDLGDYFFSKDVSLATLSEGRNLGEEYVRRNSKPTTRVESLVVKPATNPTVMWPLLLGLNLFEKVRVLRTPPGGGPRIDLEAFVIGIEHDAEAENPADWTVTLNLMNAEPFQNTWVLDREGSTMTLAY